jgi:hypothetical protein
LSPKPEMLTLLRQRESDRLAQTLSRQLNAMHVPTRAGRPRVWRLRPRHQYSYRKARSNSQPGHLHVGTLEATTRGPMRGHAVTGLIQQHRVTWMLTAIVRCQGVADAYLLSRVPPPDLVIVPHGRNAAGKE